MLQRIQTIYLLLATICSVLMLFFPIFQIVVVDTTGNQSMSSSFGAYGVHGDTTSAMPLYLIFVFSAMLSIIAIFLYKNRKKQLLICRLNLLFQIVVAISFLLVYFFGLNYISSTYTDLGYLTNNVRITIGLGYYLLFLGIPFLLLAIRGIRADEALLKSLDRLR